MSANTPLNAALAALVMLETKQSADLAKTRGAMTAIREILGVAEPPPPASASAPHVAPKPRIKKDPDPEHGRSKGGQMKAAICAALKRGPLTTVELASAVGLEKSSAGYHLRQLKAAGVVVFVGAGRATKIALAGTPAKEAP